MGSARKVQRLAYYIAGSFAVMAVGAVGIAAIVARFLWAALDRRER